MAVNSTHPKYDEMLPKWKRCRDVAKGQDAVRAAGDAYLPRLKDQEDSDYKGYSTRAVFFNATWRTIAGLCGMLFRKPPVLEISGVSESLLETVTQDGQPFNIFALKATEECLTTGRLGVLIDFPVVIAEGLTQADAVALNLRPTMAMYQAESIINWKESVIANNKVLTQVVMLEELEIGGDEFESKCCEAWRVLDLTELGYRVRLFKLKEGSEELFEQVGEDIFPKMGGQSLDFIPFYFLSTDDTSTCPDEPPLIDLVDLNLAHYRTSADYEHGCHFTGLPTGWIAGHTLGEGEKIYLGSQHMMVFPQPDTRVGFLEFSGAGLGQLEKNLERKEGQMAILGARMLESQKAGIEAAETASIHRAGENSLLASAGNAISLGMTQALSAFDLWAGGTGEVAFKINTDFFPKTMDAGTLASLVSAWQMGAISKETLFANLKQGQVVADSRTFEDEEVKILNQLR